MILYSVDYLELIDGKICKSWTAIDAPANATEEEIISILMVHEDNVYKVLSFEPWHITYK